MINLTTLWTGTTQSADRLRYGVGHGGAHSAATRRPVVVWNITQSCNLHCIHCYAHSEARTYPDELTPAECSALIADLKDFEIPVLLLSGGEPLV
ncbi:MAG: radical SAM protein, partial [Verrucomicrobiia bacterium]